MIVFINLGGQHERWAGPAMLVATLLLNGGLSMLLSLMDGIINWQEWDVDEWEDSDSSSGGSWLWDLVDLAILAFLGFVLYKLCRYLQQVVQQRRGVWYMQSNGGRAPMPQQRQRSAQNRQALFEEIAAALQKLPTEVVASRADLEHLCTKELKERLQHAGLAAEAEPCIEKHDLVDLALGAGGSSGSSCSICCEEYAGGGEEDVVRVLPCHHRFHVECVDRWFLSAMDYSRDPACPLCNAPLLARHRSTAAAR